GYRLYTSNDVNTLRFIKRARTLGFTIKRIGLLVALWHDNARASSEVKKIALAHISELETKIAELVGMKEALQELAEACSGTDLRDCPILHDLEMTRSSDQTFARSEPF